MKIVQFLDEAWKALKMLLPPGEGRDAFKQLHENVKIAETVQEKWSYRQAAIRVGNLEDQLKKADQLSEGLDLPVAFLSHREVYPVIAYLLNHTREEK